MEGRPNLSPAGLLYYNNMHPQMQGVHDRMWDRQTPPPYHCYYQDAEPPRYGAHLHDARDMGRLDYGIPPDRELDYFQPDPPRYGGRGGHVFDAPVYGGTDDETQFGNRHDDGYGYGMRDMGGHHGQFDVRRPRIDRGNEEFIDEMGFLARDHYPRFEYRDNRDLSPGNVEGLGSGLRHGAEPRPHLFNDGIGLDGMSLLTPNRYPRHDYHENRYLGLGDVGGLGSGFEPRPYDFNDSMGLDVRGVREFEREMRGTRAQRRDSFHYDVEDDAIRDDFRAEHHRTTPYRSRYGAGPGYHSEFHLEDNDPADEFRGPGPGLHRSRYPVEDEFELDNEDLSIGTMRPREDLRRHIHRGATHSDFNMKPHKARRGARSRVHLERQSRGMLDDDDLKEPRHISDSEYERIEQRIQRRVNRRKLGPRRIISDSEDERTGRFIQPRAQGHRARTTAAHSTTEIFDSNIADLPPGRHTTSQSPLRPRKRRSRHQTLRPQANDDAHRPKERHEPAASPGTGVKAPTQAPVRPQPDLATSTNSPADRPAEAATPIKAAVQESPRGGPTAQRSTRQTDRQPQVQGDQDDDAENNHVASGLHTAVKGQQSSGRDGNVRVESGDASKADVGADSFSDGSDDGFDTPGSGSEGSDDGGFVQSFICITL